MNFNPKHKGIKKKTTTTYSGLVIEYSQISTLLLYFCGVGIMVFCDKTVKVH